MNNDFVHSSDSAFGLAIQSDGMIIAVGQAIFGGRATFGVARYNPDGSLETTFGGGSGKVSTSFGNIFGDSVANAVANQRDDKIVVASATVRSGSGVDFSLERYMPDGLVANSSGSFDQVATDFAGGDDGAYGIALQGDGKIVVAASVSESLNGTDFGLARSIGQPVGADLSIINTAQPDVLADGEPRNGPAAHRSRLGI